MRISNGLWVGGSLTPNKHIGSDNFPGNIDLLKKYKNNVENRGPSNEGDYSPPVFSCPCCGNKLVKEIQINDNKELEVVGRWGYNQITSKFKGKPFPTNENSSNPFYMHCTNTKCHFYIADSEYKLTTNNKSAIIGRTLQYTMSMKKYMMFVRHYYFQQWIYAISGRMNATIQL